MESRIGNAGMAMLELLDWLDIPPAMGSARMESACGGLVLRA